MPPTTPDSKPYSDAWLRMRGALYNPLNGQAIKHIDEPVEIFASTAEEVPEPRVPEAEVPPPIANPTTKGVSTSQQDSRTSSDSNLPYEDFARNLSVPRSGIKYKLLLGAFLAIAAALLADHYLVPMFSKPVRLVVPKNSESAPTKAFHATAPYVAPVKNSPITVRPSTPSSVQSKSTVPESTGTSAGNALTTHVPVSPVIHQVTKAVVVTPPAYVAPAPAPAPVPAPHHSESNAQYEQQHLNQLMSPLG